MLPKEKRISYSLFKEISKERGIVYHSPHLSLKVISENEADFSKFAFVVSKKVTKLAVKRNLLRRRGYSVIKDLDIKKGFYCIFFFKKGADKTSFEEIKEEITQLLQKAGVVN
ncbi:ribonuclease P protein component [Patescibacteria group bacterium]